jgi:cytochrome P450
MGPERLVLGRKHGVDQRFGEIDETQLHPALARVGIDDLPVDPAHHRRQRRLVGQQFVGRRQAAQDQDPQQQQQCEHRAQRITGQAKPAFVAPIVAKP